MAFTRDEFIRAVASGGAPFGRSVLQQGPAEIGPTVSEALKIAIGETEKILHGVQTGRLEHAPNSVALTGRLDWILLMDADVVELMIDTTPGRRGLHVLTRRWSLSRIEDVAHDVRQGEPRSSTVELRLRGRPDPLVLESAKVAPGDEVSGAWVLAEFTRVLLEHLRT